MVFDPLGTALEKSDAVVFEPASVALHVGLHSPKLGGSDFELAIEKALQIGKGNH
jgi:hypothetical protein